MYMSGIDLYVMPDQWCIHHEHDAKEMVVSVRDADAKTSTWQTFIKQLCLE
jgi:hypothetical protein